MALTKTEIFAAADRLAAEGKTPTLSDVRKAVGGGSFTTISDVMKEWRERQAAVVAIREAPPDEIAARLLGLGSEIWSLARDKADGRLQSEREALQQKHQRLEEQMSEAAAMADSLAMELETARRDADRLMAQIAGLESELERARDEVRSAQTKAGIAEGLREIAEASLERERLARSEAESRAGTVERLEQLLARVGPQKP